MTRFASVICISLGVSGLGCSSPDHPAPASGSEAADVPGGKSNGGNVVTVYSTRKEPAGTKCEAGGIALLSGPDRNRNGVLDSGEVTSTRYICHGTEGTAGVAGPKGDTGMPGSPGVPGADGKTSLTRTENVSVGSTACPTGGIAVSTGLDSDRSGALEESEVASTSYVCNGAAGPAGSSGLNSLIVTIPQEVGGSYCADGGQGVYSGLDASGDGLLQPVEVQNTFFVCNGAKGEVGANGAQALVATSAEPAGENCAEGGTKASSGIDSDGDGTLQAAEATGVAYVCNGAPGAPGAPGTDGASALLATEVEPAGENCAQGGVAIRSGVDLDRSGGLEAGETTDTDFVCNGAQGADGLDGTTPLITTAGEAPGPNCALSGFKIEVGVDQNADGTLQPDELTSTTYVCNGVSEVWQVMASYAHSCAVLRNTTMKCWGANNGGQLGNGSTQRSPLPVSATGLSGVVSVAGGYSHTCAALIDGTVRCWGSVGTGTVGGLTGVKSLAGLGFGMCALLGNGTVRCWGSEASSTTPVAVTGLSGVAAISASDLTACALLTDGTARCWGYNEYGSLGDGTRVSSNVPVAVNGLTGITSITANVFQSCAALADGTARCWGGNFYGMLGDGTFTNSLTPVAVVGLSNVATVTSGWYHVCAQLTDGSVSCWGENSRGQLGNGTTIRSNVPVAVDGLTTTVATSSGYVHNCALLASGAVRCWGNNEDGQLGNGSSGFSASSATPTLVLF
jgi:alpha-tubulin suppressor-like RCC1 family protein